MGNDIQTLVGETNLETEYSRGWVTEVDHSSIISSFYYEKGALVRTIKLPVSSLVQYSEFKSDEPTEEII
jgi:hypothetical protein